MASNTNVGLGIGLQGKLTAPARVFSAQESEKQYQRKLNIADQKEKDDELDAIKKKILLDKSKVHRLLAKDVSDKTTTALKDIINAKQTDPTDYLSKVYDIYGNLQTTLNEAVSKSASLKKFEDDVTSTTGKEYVSGNIVKAYDLMNKSYTLDEWYNNMKTAEIPNSNFFSYSPEVKAFNYAVVPKSDPDLFVRAIEKQKAGDVISATVPMKKNAKGQMVPVYTDILGTVRTKQEADDAYAELIKANKNSTAGIKKPYSGEDMFEDYMSDTNNMTQYADRFPETANMTEADLKEHFLTNFYDPNSKRGKKEKPLSGGSTVNNYISPAEQDAREFKFSEEETEFEVEPATLNQQTGKVATEAKVIVAKGGVPISLKESVSKLSLPESRFRSIKDNKPPAIGKLRNMQMNEVRVIPMDASGNIVYKNEYKSKKYTWTPVVYVQFAKTQEVGEALTDLTTGTYVIPLKYMKSNIANQPLKKGERESLGKAFSEAELHAVMLNRSK